MLGLEVSTKDAETTRKKLLEACLILKEYELIKSKSKIIFPIINKKNTIKGKLVKKKFKKKIKKETFDDVLKQILSKKELNFLKTGRDIIGKIAILEIPKELEKKENEIAKALLKTDKVVKTVLKKAGEHSGRFRLQKYKFLAGIKTKETNYKENNILLKFNIEKVYFSPRLSSERKRISKLINPREKILIMFSGCAPYPIVLSKNTKAEKIIGIELNPEGHKYGLKNLIINKTKNVDLINGNVSKEVPKLKEKFDRIIMPLPRDSPIYLDIALNALKTKGIIHLYYFVEEDKIEEIGRKLERKNLKLIKLIKAGQHAPRKYRVCYDFKKI